MQTRRQFLVQAGAVSCAGGLLAAGGTQMLPAADQSTELLQSTLASKPLRILILGGTGYIGPYHVHAALDRGHKVAVFSRGKTPAELPPNVERLTGDRASDLESIRNRDWDAVIDLATFVPNWVRTLGEALKERVTHYTFISTAAVYEHPKPYESLYENSPVLAYAGSEDPYSMVAPRDVREYGALKVLCEREAEKQFPGRTLVLRPGYIVGPEDPQGYFTYLPARFEKGGEILISGNRSTLVQFIDVRDLADNAIRLAEKRAMGIYNTVGPAAHTHLSQLVSAARTFAPTPIKETWVPAAWLAVQQDRAMWGKLLFWSFVEPDGWAWSMQMNNDRALAAGLTVRPLIATLADTLHWYQKLPEDRQAKLLSVSWQTYLRGERDLLRAWHAEQSKRT